MKINDERIYQKTLEYRQKYRQENPLSGRIEILHVAVALLLTFSSIAYAITQLTNVSYLELSTIPVLFISANLIIYFLHRFVLHQRLPFFDYSYRMHTLMHHHYFTDELYGYDSNLDLDMILFPFWFVFFVSFILAPLLGLIASLSFSSNVVWLTVAMVNVDYLLYEIVHYCSHLDEDALIHKIPLFRFMRNHHRLHHNMHLMSQKNFDIIAPLFDPIFKTLKK